MMRTTVDIDEDLLQAAKVIARTRSVSLGTVISELMRKGLLAQRPSGQRAGFPVFEVPEDARPITLEDVQRADDEP